MRGETDADQAGEVAEEEEVRRDARVHAGIRRIVGLRENVRQRQQRRQPERAAHPRGSRVLAQPMPLETEIADADGHERERHVEDRHRVGRGEPRRDRARAEPDQAFVQHADGHVQEHEQPAGRAHHVSSFPRRDRG